MKTLEPKMILAGDVGGTKTRLGLFSISKDYYRLVFEKSFPSKNYRKLEVIVKEFLKGQKKIGAASFGVAGPVTNGIVKATNLPWVISTKSLHRELCLEKVGLINDLVANAYGIFVLKKNDFEILNAGKIQKGNAALLSAGTGLGEAILFWDGKRHIPSPSEGGHIEFGPKNALEIDLLQYLFDRFGHVSYERILSGEGLFSHLSVSEGFQKVRWRAEMAFKEDGTRRPCQRDF